jgi:hypothetical protein
VLGLGTFNGNAAIQIRQRVLPTSGDSAGLESEHYLYQRFDGAEHRDFGGYFSSAMSGGGTYRATATRTPSLLFKADLTTGQSFSHTHTLTQIQTAPTPVSAPLNLTVTVVSTFLGFETVTVPAGTFVDACKWEFAYSGDLSTAYTSWYARGHGLAVKQTQGEMETVLTFASRNGVQLAP